MPIEDSDIADLLQQRLLSAKTVRDLVDGRIRPDFLEQGEELPAIRYEMVTSENPHNLDGPSTFVTTRVRFDCYGRTSAEAKKVANRVRNVLNGFSGTIEHGDATTTVYDCILTNRYDQIDSPASGSGKPRRRRVLDFSVNHTETIPSLALT